MPKIRSPVCTVVGHVDHGKSSLLDKIRGTAIVKTEAGLITQAIGASIIPLTTIKKICGVLLKSLNMDFTIPGVLFIDTPGHAAFTNLRKRGGNIADIAILVIDINEGFKPQTVEALEILRSYKVPFVIAANKIDLLKGWQPKDANLLKNISLQKPEVQQELDNKLYELVGKLHQCTSMDSERFDRVDDFTKKVVIIPTSAKTGEGIPELLMVLSGLAQKFLNQCLECEISGPARGTILEVKEEPGLGPTIDVIIYDGTLKVNDTIVIAGLKTPIVTKVKALFEPAPLSEMRDKRAKFKSVKEVSAATGVRISAAGLEYAISGMPLTSCKDSELEKVKKEIQKEVEEVIIETGKEGIIIKADSLGSLEAVVYLLKEKNISIRKATVGDITKKDLADAESVYEKAPLQAVILGFNVKISHDAGYSKTGNVKVILNNIVYGLVEDLEKWQKEETRKQEAKAIETITSPCKIRLMPNYIFRQSNPAVVGVEVLAGKLKTGTELMKKDCQPITVVKEIQQDKENISEAGRGMQVAAALEHVTIGRQIDEDELLYSFLTEQEFRKLKDLKKYLKHDEKELLKEIAELMRKQNPLWGV